MIRLLIRFYQICLSPVLHLLAGPGGGCRFEPTCSQYFLEAVEAHGNIRGSWLGVKRLCRCHPWGGHGTTRCRRQRTPRIAADMEKLIRNFKWIKQVKQ